MWQEVVAAQWGKKHYVPSPQSWFDHSRHHRNENGGDDRSDVSERMSRGDGLGYTGSAHAVAPSDRRQGRGLARHPFVGYSKRVMGRPHNSRTSRGILTLREVRMERRRRSCPIACHDAMVADDGDCGVDYGAEV